LSIEEFVAWVKGATGLTPEILGKLVASLLILLILWGIQQGLLHVLGRRVEDVRVRYSWQKSLGYLLSGLGVLLIGSLWLDGIRGIATYLGLLSAGLAIALRDLIVGFVAWIFILWNRPFAVGDRVQIGSIAGDVIDLRIFQFTLLEIGNWVDADQSTGRVVHVPNGRIFSEPLINFESGFRFIWNEIQVLVTSDSDWREARQVLQEIADSYAQEAGLAAEQKVREAARHYMIYYTKLTPTVYTRVIDKGIQLTIRYLCEPRLRRTSTDAIWIEILERFHNHPNIKLYRSA
jgi:small-conductance mechanosensitive channel